MRIRRATVSDVDGLVALNRHVQNLHAGARPDLFLADPSAGEAAEVFQRWIEDPAALWLLADDGEPCGYLYAQLHDLPETLFRPALRVCDIVHLAVRPESRRRGIARRLLAALAEEAGRQGFDRIELEAWSFNHEARKAFARLGFQGLSERMELVRKPK